LFLFSPMAFGLSLTTHAHLVSRGLLALGFLLADRAERHPRTRAWWPAGIALGLAGLARPVEVAALIAPWLLHRAYRGLRGDAAALRVLAWLAAGAGLALALYLFHNLQVTGQPGVHARQLYVRPDLPPLAQLEGLDLFWQRLGANTLHNLFLLIIWFLGPLGAVWVVLGQGAGRTPRLLGLGVLALLGVGLLHDDHGIHPLGPMHYQDCAVPLTVLAVYGLRRMFRHLPARTRAPAASVLVLAVGIGLGVFNAWNSIALRRQALIQREILEAVHRAESPPALVFAPRFSRVVQSVPRYFATSSWVFEWPRPRPDLSDPVLVVHDAPGLREEIRALFPGRRAYELRLRDPRTPPHLELAPIP
jgi:hypothetical protein